MTSDRTSKEDSLTLRDHLAIDRTALANERNLLAFVRTSIAFIAGGFGLLKLFTDTISLIVIGWLLIIAGVIILGIGFLRFIKFSRKIQKLGGQVYSIPNGIKIRKGKRKFE